MNRGETGHLGDDGVVRDSVREKAWVANFFGLAGLVCLAIGLGDLFAGNGDIGGSTFVTPAAGTALILMYYFECFVMSKACSYVTNVMKPDEFIAYVKKVQQASPQCTFDIQNYHYETRKDSDGKNKRVRVNTHHARMNYPVKGFTDETLSPDAMIAMFHLMKSGEADLDLEANELIQKKKKQKERPMVLLCKFHLDFHPRDEHTESDFPSVMRQFYADNIKDTQYDQREVESLVEQPDLLSHCTVLLAADSSNAEDALPWYMQTSTFVIASLLFCSVPMRLYMYRKTQKTTWNITKHFSTVDEEAWEAEPMYSLRNSENRALAAVVRQQNSREGAEHGGSHSWSYVPRAYPEVEADVATPAYWKNQDASQAFDTKHEIDEDTMKILQAVLDDTFITKSTRDRKDGPMPTRLKVVRGLRIEDSELWSRYCHQRDALKTLRGNCTEVKDLDGSGIVKTSRVLPDSWTLDSSVNELFLYHGTSPTGALGIGETGFNIGLAGSAVGTMFGPGAYMAECSSKSDEYAKTDESGVFSGIYGLLLCRVAVGAPFRTTKSDIPAIDAAMNTGNYDAVLGDREAVVNTYREFVVFKESQIYPEFIILYRREHDDGVVLPSAVPE
eukprot:TRINITY_DN29863_c0_g1_i1.p1 TRINITY_DN29863_c0_g1~~TRINITY_DN29863_c0_g1_i1.p1  ORF type:complete len:616 (+),score=114.66 TRINITY_DN29863_c0_g1_i1:161-2008(+)